MDTGRITRLTEGKSYASEANLLKALDKFSFPVEGDRALIVRNMDGRYTAIFQMDMSYGRYVMLYAQHGFTTVQL